MDERTEYARSMLQFGEIEYGRGWNAGWNAGWDAAMAEVARRARAAQEEDR